MARFVDAAVADLEAHEPAAVAEPVGDELAEEPGLQQSVQDHARQPHAPGVLLVVMNLVEVALGAGVLNELARGRVLHELGQLLPHLDRSRGAHRRIAVPRRRATRSPRWLVYSVSKMMKSRFPLEPSFS